MSDVRTLCYVRPWNRLQMRSVAAAALPGCELTDCSEHARVDQAGLAAGYASAFRSAKESRHLDHDLADDLIARCRVLRKVAAHEARRHLEAMSLSVVEVLSKVDPQAVISLTVDSFVIDLLRHHAQARGIPFVGLVPTFVNGHFRVTARGEPTANPAPTADPSALKSCLLDARYVPAFAAASMTSQYAAAWKRWARTVGRMAFYHVRTALARPPWNYHHWQARLESSATASVHPVLPTPHSDWRDRVTRERRLSLYVPLQMFPEATVDYWCPTTDVIDYPETLGRLIDRLGSRFHLVFKEHPNVVGTRPSGFYERLHRGKGCTMVPTFAHSTEVLSRTDATLVWTGSVGFEAALRGKPVLHLGHPYYISGPRFMEVTPETDPAATLSHIETCSSTAITDAEQLDLVEKLGAQLFEGRFLNDGTWDSQDPEHQADAERMGTSLRPLLASFGVLG